MMVIGREMWEKVLDKIDSPILLAPVRNPEVLEARSLEPTARVRTWDHSGVAILWWADRNSLKEVTAHILSGFREGWRTDNVKRQSCTEPS
jgi:hypothetical protein